MDNKIKKTILLLGDIAVLYLSLYLTLSIRYLAFPSQRIWNDHFGPFTIIFVFWIIIFYIADLYNLYIAVNNSKFFQITIKSIAIAGLFSAAFFYSNPDIGIAPKTNLLIFLVTFSILFFFWRRLYNWLLGAYLPKNNIVFVGSNNQTTELMKLLTSNPHFGYNVNLVIDNDGYETISGKKINAENLKDIIIGSKINILVLASDPHQSSELRAALFSCLPLGINIISLPHFYETVTGRVPIEAINQMWFLENLSRGNKSFFNFYKRCFDLLLALFILIVTIIFWPLIALAIKAESKGPVFYRQVRSGKNGQPFSVFKFRTMTETDNHHGPTVVNDKRVTKFGSYLRRTRIDELPQILNILAGDMSFVGPRPERPEFINELEKQIPFYQERMLVKPGLTGWDQVSGEYHSPSYEDTMKKLQYDLFYIKNRSIYLDLSIILKTIATILSRSGV